MIRITATPGSTAWNTIFERKGLQIFQALATKLSRISVQLGRKIVTEYLNGQVLQHRSGVLAGSVHPTPVEVTNDGITVGVESSGGPAFYGRIQSSGGTRAYEIRPVNKQALAFFPGGSLGGGGGFAVVNKQTIAKLYKRLSGELKTSHRSLDKFSGLGGIVVKSVMHPPLPARPFMAPALNAMRAQITSDLNDAIKEGLRR